jgi:predicted secreted protein
MKIITRLLLLIPLLCLLSCAERQVLLEATCDDLVKNQHLQFKVEAHTGNSVLISACSSPTTGYKWTEMAYISDRRVVQQSEHRFIPPTGDLPIPAGTEVWKFDVLEKGSSTISLVYSQPWEGANSPSWTIFITVIVR